VHAALAAFAARHERGLAAGFFAAGFLFDIFTLGRIDSWLTIAQQAAYLAIVTAILVHQLADRNRGQSPISPDGIEAAGTDGNRALTPISRFYFEWRNAALHFVLGSLLSAYTLFFFKSSSLLVSFAFMLVLVGLLVANELPQFKRLGLPFKFALLALCYLAFFAAVTPIATGSIGVFNFLLSMAIGTVPLAALGVYLRARREIMIPLGSVLLVFLLFYFFRLIPPVPLSIPFMGVYHGVERTKDGYLLQHERPFWKLWHHGDQDFRAQGGDRVFVYFRIFSPGRFADQVVMRWYWKDDKRGWTLHDTIPIKIVGGREEGFRGYAFKTNYPFGDWKVQIETGDGREIGRIYFDVQIAPLGERQFTAELD
jgi:hypothetical protein